MFEAIGFLKVFIIIFALIIIMLLPYFIFHTIGMWKMFKKCGKNGWGAIIPYYNIWILVEIAGLKKYWFIIWIASNIAIVSYSNSTFDFVPIIAVMLGNAAINYNISKKFNKSTAWFILSIFFGGILLPILGYSSSDKYDASVEVNENSFFK